MSQDDSLAAQRRENPEPHEGGNPVPWHVLLLVGVLVVFGIAYIATSDVETPGEWGDARSRSELSGPKAPQAGARIDGAALYASLCAACHQATGRGLPGVFPPLAGSEWVNGKEGTLAAIVLHGVTGELQVAGSTYQGAMPPFKDQLDDTRLAALLTHVRAQWGNSGPAVTPETVAAARTAHAARTGPFAGGKELQSLP